MRGDAAAALGEIAGAARGRRRSGRRAHRPRRVHPLRDAPEARAGGRRPTPARLGDGARARRGLRRERCRCAMLSRAWQMLLKGIAGGRRRRRARCAAADMVLVRLCHAADLPTPDEAIRMLRGDSAAPPPPSPAAAPRRRPQPSAAAARRAAQRRAAARSAPAAAPAPPRRSAPRSAGLRSFDDVDRARARRARPAARLRAGAARPAGALRAGAASRSR